MRVIGQAIAHLIGWFDHQVFAANPLLGVLVALVVSVAAALMSATIAGIMDRSMRAYTVLFIWPGPDRLIHGL